MPQYQWKPKRDIWLEKIQAEERKATELQHAPYEWPGGGVPREEPAQPPQPSLVERALQANPWGPWSAFREIPGMMGWAQRYLQEYYSRPVAGTFAMPWVATFDPTDPGAQKYRQMQAEEAAQWAEDPLWKRAAKTAAPGYSWIRPFTQFFPGTKGREAYEEWEAPKYLRGALEIAAEVPLYIAVGTAIGSIPIRGVPIRTWEARGMQAVWKRTIGRAIRGVKGRADLSAWHKEPFYKQYGQYLPKELEKDIYSTWKLYKMKAPGYKEAAEGAWKGIYQNIVSGRYGYYPTQKPAPPTGFLPAFAGGLPANVRRLLPMSSSKWATLAVSERANLVRALGLSGRIVSKSWEALSTADKAVLTEVPPTIAEAPPVAPREPLEVPPVTPAVPQAKMIPEAYTAEEITMLEAELGGLREWIDTEPAQRLIGLIKKTGWYRGEVSNLTLKQYRDLTGKEVIPPSILTADKKHVRWEYSLDSAATEMGYASGDELKIAIERAGEASARMARLEAELSAVPRVPLTRQLRNLYSEIDIEIKAAQAAVKGLRGEEARITRQSLVGLQRELAYVDRTLKGFTQRPDLPEATKLRQMIHSWARYKGLTDTALRNIYSSVSGRRQLRVIPQEQLVEILSRVKTARPVTIRSRKVITAKTENKVQSLNTTLTAQGQMDEANFTRIMEELNIDTPRYVNQYHFATEREGKNLIRALLDDAEWIGKEIETARALADNPEIAGKIDDLMARLEKVLILDGEPIAKATVLQDIRYYAMEFEKRTGKPIYKAFQWVNDTHLRIRYNATRDFDKVINSTPEFQSIAGNDAALQRATDYIASKNKLGPKAPANITNEEIKLADSISGVLRDFENRARLAKFYEAYELYPDNVQAMRDKVIPDAPGMDLRRAVDIYEGKGKDALIEYLNTRTWGVRKSGYEPLSVVNPRMYLKGVKVGTFGKGHIRPREGVSYPAQDRNILQRLNSYIRQMYGMTELQPSVRRFIRVFEDAAPLIKNPQRVAENFTRAINEMKGYRDVGGPMARGLLRLYGQTMAAVFNQPHLWIRNLMIQNLGFHPDRHRFFLPSTHKPLSEQNLIYFRVFVSQKMGLIRDYLMRQFKPLPGFGRLVRMANRVSRYPWTDETNRTKSFQMRYNRVQEALTKYSEDKNIDKLVSRSGLVGLEPLQQKEALGLLARDTVDYGIAGLEPVSGEEAFAQYIAKETTNNVHWLYERSQRAPVEMGSVGRIFSNLLTFPRSYYQKLIFQGRKLRPGSMATSAEKRYAFKTIIGMIVMGILVGEGYNRITGKKFNPGHPLYILTWTPGGLALAVAVDLSNTVYDLVMAAYGDKDALARFTTSLPKVARILIPFYNWTINSIETATDKRYIDRYALRLLRAKIDEEYEPRHEYYQMERDLKTKLQHAFFAGEAPEKEKEEEPKYKWPGRQQYEWPSGGYELPGRQEEYAWPSGGQP